METVLFFIVFIMSLIAWFITLLVYFTHDDIKRGSKTQGVSTESLYKTLLPLEMGLHATIIVFLFSDSHYYLAAFNIPLLMYNFKILILG